MKLIAVADIHEIAPPVDYSLIPPWVYYAAAIAGICLLALIVRWIRNRARRPGPVASARDRALEALRRIEGEIGILTPYQFSIAASDILRRYVTEQHQLPVTTQTSVEFLATLAKSSPFSPDETNLLEDFLGRCDLIKFARYEASIEDSRRLLEEAFRFVKGATLATA
ncbi:MAG TPA: DUF4381 family protein [Chthoniobacterales bacterium]|jgi:hypothetical protein|nr:DUF4381 family protein [Chthoniobacterales bacterium]